MSSQNYNLWTRQPSKQLPQRTEHLTGNNCFTRMLLKTLTFSTFFRRFIVLLLWNCICPFYINQILDWIGTCYSTAVLGVLMGVNTRSLVAADPISAMMQFVNRNLLNKLHNTLISSTVSRNTDNFLRAITVITRSLIYTELWEVSCYLFLCTVS